MKLVFGRKYVGVTEQYDHKCPYAFFPRPYFGIVNENSFIHFALSKSNVWKRASSLFSYSIKVINFTTVNGNMSHK